VHTLSHFLIPVAVVCLSVSAAHAQSCSGMSLGQGASLNGFIPFPADNATGPKPTIASFTANPTTVTAGQPVTLSWNVTGASYFVVSPQVGAISGNSVVVTPTATITYTLYGTNEYGRSKKTLKVTVQ
jgi:hypothetical protein